MPWTCRVAVASLTAVLVLVSATRTPATTAADVCAPSANPCVLQRVLAVTPGSTIDVGTRALHVAASGTFNVAAGDTLTLKAGAVRVLPGGLIHKALGAGPGPVIVVESTGNVEVQRSGTSNGIIDVSSDNGGGTIRLTSGGAVSVAGHLRARGTSLEADGGLIDVTAAGDASFGGDVGVSAGLNGIGGDVLVQAGGRLAVSGAVDADGGLGGGSIDFTGGPELALDGTLTANGTGPGFDAGTVDLTSAGSLVIRNRLEAAGSGSIDFGGFGGDVTLLAAGTVQIDGVVAIPGGGPDGSGGNLDVEGAQVVQTQPILAGAPGVFSSGGALGVTASGRLQLGALVDLHGGEQGAGGFLTAFAVDLRALGEIDADGPGGDLLFSTLVFDVTPPVMGGPVTISGNVHARGPIADIGGSIEVDACDVTVAAGGVVGTAGIGASNVVQASGRLTVAGTVSALPGGTNTFEYRTAALPPQILGGSSVLPVTSPALVPTLPACGTSSGARCGNGTVEAGETCDDGNTAGGDCCSATCQRDPAGTSCLADTNVCTDDVCDAGGVCIHPNNADACDDGKPSTHGDTCTNGICIGTVEPDGLLTGQVVIVKPLALLRFVGKPGTAYAVPDAGFAPTSSGATLTVFDTSSSAGIATFDLPAPGWKGLGRPAGSKGFKYTGSGLAGDGCKSVLIRASGVRALCAGPDVALHPPFAGDVALRLTVGGAKRYCARLGGIEIQNAAALLKRKAAPAPGACP